MTALILDDLAPPRHDQRLALDRRLACPFDPEEALAYHAEQDRAQWEMRARAETEGPAALAEAARQDAMLAGSTYGD